MTSLLVETPAFGQPFLPGDVLYQVNQHSVHDIESLVTAVTQPPTGGPVVVQVERGQKLMFIDFELQ